MGALDAALSARIRDAYQEILARGLRASMGRQFEVVGVTKTFPAETVLAGYRAGLRSFGENYADELLAKASNPALIFDDDPIKWHFVGAIQSKRIAKLAKHVAVWHSVCREKEIDRIANASPGSAMFVQVSFSDEEQRNGVALSQAARLVNLSMECGLKVLGLMVVPPLVDRGLLGEIFTAVNDERLRLGLQSCSMGMSEDFELALARGSTHIRIGRALFGGRDGAVMGSGIGQGGPG